MQPVLLPRLVPYVLSPRARHLVTILTDPTVPFPLLVREKDVTMQKLLLPVTTGKTLLVLNPRPVPYVARPMAMLSAMTSVRLLVPSPLPVPYVVTLPVRLSVTI